MTLAHCASCDLWLGPNDACLHIAANPVGENAERNSPSGRTDGQVPGLTPSQAGATARGGSFCPPTMGAAAPRFCGTFHMNSEWRP